MTEPQTSYIRWIPAPGNIKRIGRLHALLYAATGGLLGARLDGLDILLLTTTGRRSGQLRTVPLPYFRLCDRTVLVASFGGHSADPAWLRNIEREPQVQIRCGAQRSRVRASILQGEERARLWAALTHAFPRYGVYQTRTTRQIPLVELQPTPRGARDTSS